MDRCYVLVHTRSLGNGYKAVVALGLAFLDLLRLYNADKASRDQAAGKGRLVHEQEHVEGITVFAQC